VQKGKCYRNFANYGLIRLNRSSRHLVLIYVISFLIKLYLILLISVQTCDVTGAKILPFAVIQTDPWSTSIYQAKSMVLGGWNLV
jgi:hypothetical protein